jgi:hypothetical protein
MKYDDTCASNTDYFAFAGIICARGRVGKSLTVTISLLFPLITSCGYRC